MNVYILFLNCIRLKKISSDHQNPVENSSILPLPNLPIHESRLKKIYSTFDPNQYFENEAILSGR
jgi:hypothetical protein